MLCEDHIHKPDYSKAYSEALLFANINGCPIIDKRLSLGRRHGLHSDDSRGLLVKLPLQDDIVLSTANFALAEQNEMLGAKLRNPSMVGAWLERVGKTKAMYHIMVEATQGKAKRKFYAAIGAQSSDGGDADVVLMDWVAADSHRATTPLN